MGVSPLEQNSNNPISVLFAPDYRGGNPYQRLLAEALTNEGVSVSFLSSYQGPFSLMRGLCSQPAEVLHLHWPEHYCGFGGSFIRAIRRMRYPVDLALSARSRCLAFTVHNLKAHDERRVLDSLVRFTLVRADAVFVHSETTKNRILELARVESSKIHVIPHGDLSVSLRITKNQQAARDHLSLRADGRYVLAFGRVAPYKGIEELLKFWRSRRPQLTLIVAGAPESDEYAARLRSLVSDTNVNVLLYLRPIPEDELAELLAASDCAVFNYPNLLTSGSAALARSVGLPIIFPDWIKTVDLGEPSVRVFRFSALDDEFLKLLEKAASLSFDYDSGAEWRRATSWQLVAKKTLAAYRSVLFRDSSLRFSANAQLVSD
jgi:beta-1,4-mannosyltransferase